MKRALHFFALLLISAHSASACSSFVILQAPGGKTVFRSEAVYHDDWADYSTNEPTMDGTASLVFSLSALSSGRTANSSPRK